MVAGTLGGDGQAVELARQADGEVADVDHFLHFAQAFLGDLAGLPGHQFAQLDLVLAQHFAVLADQLATARRRHLAPGLEGLCGAGDLRVDFGAAFQAHGADAAAVDGRMNGVIALLVEGRIDTKTVKQCSNHGNSCFNELMALCRSELARESFASKLAPTGGEPDGNDTSNSCEKGLPTNDLSDTYHSVNS
ncbi:hypothetical protein D9M71_475250 [compost metagenome]